MGPFACMLCARSFTTQGGLRTHEVRTHAVYGAFSARVCGSTCLSCGVEFHTRVRFIAHSRRKLECGAAALLAPPRDPELVAEMRAADTGLIQTARSRGESWSTGPPALASRCLDLRNVI